MNKQSYSDRLKDPRWQKKRLEILNRDKFTCQYCFDKKSTLHVHHMAYPKGLDIWDVPNYMLITLCENCHSWVQNYGYWEDIISVLKRILLPANLFVLAAEFEELLKRRNIGNEKLVQTILEVITNDETFNEVWEKRKKYLKVFGSPDVDVEDYDNG